MEALEILKAHTWPGNVRELRNVFERGAALYPGETIGEAEALQLLGRSPLERPECLPERPPLTTAPRPQSIQLADGVPINLRELLETMELERIQCALDQADGVISEAARLLTLKRTTLIEKMRKYRVA